MRKRLSWILVLALVCLLAVPAMASGNPSGGASSIPRDPAPVFESGVCVLEPGQTEAEFIVKGRRLWNDSEYEGLGLYDGSEPITIYPGYDGYQEGTTVDPGAALTPVDGSTDLLLTIPAGDLTENTVYYVSIGGDAAAAVYIVTAENAAAVDDDHITFFSLGSSVPGDGYADKFVLPLSGYALLPDRNNIRRGGAYGLFDAAMFTDVPPAAAEEVNWYLTTGGTNGGTGIHEFGSDLPYARLDAVHYIYRFFCFEGSGGFGMFEDVGMARWFSGSSGANTAYALVDILDHSDPFDSFRPMTVRDMVVLMYNAITTPFGSRSPAGLALAESLKSFYDGSGAAGKVAAMMATHRFDGRQWPDLDREVTKLEAVDLLATGLADYNGQKINAVRTQLDADFLAAVTAAGEAGELAGYEDASGEIDALGVAEEATLTAERSDIFRENAVIEDAVYDNEGIPNASALIVEDGATVTLVNSRIISSGSNPSDPLLDRDYRFGYGAGLLAVDPGTVVKIINTDGELNTLGGSSGSMGGCLFTGTGSLIYAENGQFFSAGQHPSNTCFDGTIIYNNSTLTGGGRTFSTDFFGGKVIFYDSISDQSAGAGFVIDESTSYFVVNSYIHGGASFETNGQGQAYYENSYVDTNGSWILQNNTSMRSDCDYICGVNTIFRCRANTFLTVQKEEHGVARFVNSSIRTAGGDGYVVKVSGDEWGTNAWLLLELENTDFPAGQVFVAGARDWPNQDKHTEGTTLEISTDGASAVDLTQVVTDTAAIVTYEDGTQEVAGRMGTNYLTDIPNNGVITVNGVATGLDVVNGRIEVKNPAYADVTVTEEAVTAVYDVNGARITLIYELAPGEAASLEPTGGASR